MKSIATFFLAAILSIFSVTASAQPVNFSLTFITDKDGRPIILDNEKDWALIGSSAIFDLYIDKYMFDQVKDNYMLHGVTVYKDGEEQRFSGLDFSIKKIYTYGRLVCGEKALYITNQWYTTKEGVIVYSQTYQYGEFVSDMNDPNTTRNLVYISLCGDKV